jgi:hypothetical protein
VVENSAEELWVKEDWLSVDMPAGEEFMYMGFIQEFYLLIFLKLKKF